MKFFGLVLGLAALVATDFTDIQDLNADDDELEKCLADRCPS